MVSKSEIKQTSASLIGTKRLAQAMLAAELEEGSPLRGVRRPPQLAREMITRARFVARERQQRWRSGQANYQGELSMMNRDWLWATRFTPSNVTTEQPSIPPSRSADSLMVNQNNPTVHHSPQEAVPVAHRRPSMHDSSAGFLISSAIHNNWQRHQANIGNTQPHSRLHDHWHQSALNANNADRITGQPNFLPPRSVDPAIDQHARNQNSTGAHHTPPEAGPVSHDEAPVHSTTAGSLFSSTLHNNWQRQNPQPATTNNQPMPLHPSSTIHDNWQRHQANIRNTQPQSRLHENWRQSALNANNADTADPAIGQHVTNNNSTGAHHTPPGPVSRDGAPVHNATTGSLSRPRFMTTGSVNAHIPPPTTTNQSC